ncbi:predicted protein [Naegleria gruberi]|uniref:Predicted protein n=1 Tax=Naegleria gruberi TaxID=5762 RepID=D2VVP0_NAEGR|nr:uncharacterized protein NAEGRDRAFT_52631 [Naegleria gruberi]EFC39074.1 predicted protein [Naegleria gruberi]|eukprot:XP_002671818.1 predicted protein [Naegleria gruberi strain NEG-M]
MKKRKQSTLFSANQSTTPNKKKNKSITSQSPAFDNVVVDLIDSSDDDEEEIVSPSPPMRTNQIIEIMDENDERCKFTIHIENKTIQSIKLDTSKAKIVKQKTITNYFKKSVKLEKSTFNSYLVEAPSKDWFEKRRNVLEIRDVESNFKSTDGGPLVPVFQVIGNNSSTVNIRSSDRKLTFKLDTLIECGDNSIYHHVTVPIQNKKTHSVCVSNNLSNNSEKKIIPKLSLSFLKSLLQKNTRLGRAESCVRIASLMIYKYSFLEFLRRIQIIIVEDCLMHPCAHLITWLMINYGSKEATTPQLDNNFSTAIIPKIFIDACLQIVYDIAKVNYREDLSNCEMFISQDEMNALFGSKSAQFSEFEEDLCRSLFIRSCFGGMKGDIVLLHSQCSLWLYRFSNRVSQPPNENSKEYNIPEIFQSMLNPAIEYGSPWFKYLCSLYYSEKRDLNFLVSFLKSKPSVDLLCEDIVLSAVDFHCFPVLLGKCLEKFRELSPNSDIQDQLLMDALKKIIWHKASKLNIRTFIATLPKEEPFEDTDWYSMEWDKSLDPFEEEIFQVIEPHLREIEADTFRQQCL